MSTSNSRSVDNFFALTNTNLGLEQDRAQQTEHAIQIQLSAYILSNDAAAAAAVFSANNAATAQNDQNATFTASLSTMASTIGSIQAQAAADEGLSSAEVARAEAAELTLTNAVAFANSSIAAEMSRAQAGEQALTDNITSCFANINTNSVAINGIHASLATDEATISSLCASRTSDESHIVSIQGTIASIQGTLVVDEASAAAEVVRATGVEATLSAGVASLVTAVASDEAAIAALQSSVASFSAGISSDTVTASSVVTSSISSVGPLVISSTGDAYGTAAITLNNGNDCNGIQLDTGGVSTNPDLGDFVIKTVDRSMLMRFEGRPENLVDSTNAAVGELTFGSGVTASGRPATTFYTGIASSGVAQGNFTVKAGVVSDMNDQDTTISGTWSNFGNFAADVRLVRKGSVVTVTFSSFLATAEANNCVATYSLSIPNWAVPNNPVECCIVVATNGYRSNGCCFLNAQNAFSLLPFNGSWQGQGGLNQATSFSYLVGGPTFADSTAPVVSSKHDDSHQ